MRTYVRVLTFSTNACSTDSLSETNSLDRSDPALKANQPGEGKDNSDFLKREGRISIQRIYQNHELDSSGFPFNFTS